MSNYLRTDLLWRNCRLFKKIQNGYWVSCDQDEVKYLIYPLLTDQEKEKFNIDKHNYYSTRWATKNPTLALKYRYYFLISKDGKEILVNEPYFPYSGQWNNRSPFEVIEEFNFSDLLELEKFKPLIRE